MSSEDKEFQIDALSFLIMEHKSIPYEKARDLAIKELKDGTQD